MNQTFTTARALASGIELVGWLVFALAVASTALAFGTNSIPPGGSRLIVIGVGAVGSASGLGLVLAAQLVQAQVATAINTGQIMQHLAKSTPQTAHARMQPSIAAPKHEPISARQEPYASNPQAEGRFLRMFKGYELHKYSDGISVDGEGRYPNILAAEKRAAELAADK